MSLRGFILTLFLSTGQKNFYRPRRIGIGVELTPFTPEELELVLNGHHLLRAFSWIDCNEFRNIQKIDNPKI
jgi:hypothetical protein